MRLSNKQLEIVVNEIYEQVSKPIIKANKEAIDKVELDIEKDEYLQDYESWKLLQSKINDLNNEITNLGQQQKELANKYKDKEYNGFRFSTWTSDIFNHSNKYIKYMKEKQVNIKSYPTIIDIEKQVILAGNKDIPNLIEQIVTKFNK